MSSVDSARRYTDQEVALVLKRAAELEERRTLSGAKGLTLEELREIAREVGLSPETIDEAVTSIAGSRRRRSGGWLGGALSAKVVRGVPGRLNEADLRQLVRLVEERLDATGTVTEALGTVRWTGAPQGDRFDPTTQVSFSAGGTETQVQVVQRYPARLRIILHVLPMLWGTMIGGAIAASTVPALATSLTIGLGSAALGLGVGRGIWGWIARRAESRIDSLASDLVAEAKRLANKGA
jgi:hypothetical protein